jgi:2-dehydropantoate 2-reductase
VRKNKIKNYNFGALAEYMKIAVIGTGGVGGYFGGKMAHAGYDVTFIARGRHLNAILENGLQVKSIHGDFTIRPAIATDQLSHIYDAGLILLAIKAWQVQDMARELKGIIAEDAIVLPMQNGVLAYDELSDILGKRNVIGGLCRIMSKIESPGIITHQGIEPTILFGEMDNTKSQRVSKIQEIFEKSGIKSKIAEDIQAEIWKKFINICVSGLLAVTRSTYGEIRELKETREIMLELFEEIYAISQRMGIKIDHEFVGKTVAFIDSFPYNATSSLTRDVWENKPSEIEYQNGSVVRLGEKYGIKTPVNRFIYSCILPMEKRARNTHS